MDSSNGSLIFTLMPHRHGRVLLMVSVSDGILDFEKHLTLVVKEVNSPPEFDMESTRVTLHEELQYTDEYTAGEFNADHMLYSGPFFSSISPETFHEENQHLRFGARSVSNMGLVACVEVVCNETFTPGVGCHSYPGLALPWVGELAACNGTASLRVWATPSRYGDEVVEIILMDDGPMQPSAVSPYGWLGAVPNNNFSRLLTINMIRFRLATSKVQVFEDSNCVSLPPFAALLSHAECNRSSAAFHHIRQGFVVDVPPPTQQNVSFYLKTEETMRSPPSSATSIFSSGPSITADGTLKFALTPNAYGSTRYTVWLTDTANKSSHTVSFVLEVININDRPRLTIPARIVAFEGQPFHYVAGTDITRDDSSGNLCSIGNSING